jgi:hypothetical protein
MTSLQKFLDKKYPTKEQKERITSLFFTHLDSENLNKKKKEGRWLSTVYLDTKKLKDIEGGGLNLSNYINLEDIRIDGNYLKSPLTELNIVGCSNLVFFVCINNDLTSANFLNQLPNPEKIRVLGIYNNNIEKTDIKMFSKFVNVGFLKIGTEKEAYQKGKHNKFYGSFESYKDLKNLERICIEATDVDSGLELYQVIYLNQQLNELARAKSEEGGYLYIECSPHDVNNKCSKIKEQLKPFDYDLEAWQMNGFCKTFLNSSWEKSFLIMPISMLDEKIVRVRKEMELLIELNQANKVEKLIRLESKFNNLVQTKEKLQEKMIR